MTVWTHVCTILDLIVCMVGVTSSCYSITSVIISPIVWRTCLLFASQRTCQNGPSCLVALEWVYHSLFVQPPRPIRTRSTVIDTLTMAALHAILLSSNFLIHLFWSYSDNLMCCRPCIDLGPKVSCDWSNIDQVASQLSRSASMLTSTLCILESYGVPREQ